MTQISQLVFASSREELTKGKIICQSEDLIPIGWLTLFGGRNFCEPDQQVSDRGGTSALRDRWTTPMDAAQARINNAIEAFSECAHLWPYLAPLEILRRRLIAQGRKGFVHLNSPHISNNDESNQQAQQSLAIMENIVNLLISGRTERISPMLQSLDPLCPFVPHFTMKDHERFDSFADQKGGKVFTALAMASTGLPADNTQRFIELVQKECASDFEKREDLSAYPTSVINPAVAPQAFEDEKTGEERAPSGRGFMSKLKGMFGRK